ncbi:MAG: bifunctional 4-hydroxy-2-oxoglutarate aldolase/2-dehydro-3-deoxy-phosphogluconate aldolase [Porticoccaceae bacterium]|nr:bifunctional 4-hydroxy-2-oxoglutarate aldolase/2-dehydro-3-deoxy-phosphogluconate aldolase [Porticoccaceae bacterium]
MRNILAGHSVIPVITLDRVQDAVPLAQALVAGGLKVLEVTLRTEAAVEGIREIVKHVPDAIVGTGTVCNEQQIKLSEDLGCQFMISPGATDKLLEAGAQSSVPFLPGVASVSELMRGMEYGHRDFKFFPAEAAGGTSVLKAFAGPFGDVRFCPTGGIGLHNVVEYLALPNVLCVGGSWIAQTNLIRQQAWSEIETLAREAVELAG